MRPDPTVVITGASAGLGRAVARAFARRGARIGLIARDADALEDTRREVERLGGRAVALPADVADFDAVDGAAAAAEAAFGPIDVWVNNAMATAFSPVHALEPQELHRVTQVTYFGYVHGTMAALRRMRPRNRGTIVQVGSALAYRGIPLQSAYCGAKHAIVGFTDSLRCELLHENAGIRLTVVHMPAMNTPQFQWARTRFRRRPAPAGPTLAPDRAARAVVWAAEHGGRELWVGKSTFQTILGQMVAPALMDRILARRAWDGQFRREPLPAHYRDNLYETVPGVHAVDGPFRESLPGHYTRASTARLALAATGAAVAAGLMLGAAALARR